MVRVNMLQIVTDLFTFINARCEWRGVTVCRIKRSKSLGQSRQEGDCVRIRKLLPHLTD